MYDFKPQVLGFLRGLVYSVIFAVALAASTFLADPTHYAGLLNDSMSAIVAGLFALLEHRLEEKGQGALFGAAKLLR